MMSPEKKRRKEWKSSRALIVACRPWEWKDDFSPVNKASEELRAKTYNKWRALFEGEDKIRQKAGG
jgi:hypothetical protein